MANDGGRNGFNSIHNNFGDDFVLGIEKTNWSKVFKGGRISTLRNEINMGAVYFGVHLPSGESLNAEGRETWGNGIPVSLVN